MRLRCWTTVLCIYAIVAHADSASADDQTAFVVDMTHAIYAKGMCPGVDIVYEDLVRLAKAKKLDAHIVEEVRNGVVFLNSEGKNGERPPKDIMGRVTVASKMIAVDKSTIGIPAWCKARTQSLLKDGFIRSAEAAPTRDQVNKRLDEQLAAMRMGMPTQVSSHSKVTNVARSGMTVTYSYEDTRPANSWSASEKMAGAVAVTKFQCEGKNSRVLLESGYSMVFQYFDETGKYITQVYVDKSKCG